MKHLLVLFCLSLLAIHNAQSQDEPKRIEDPAPKELQFIGYSFTRMTSTNITPTNDVLQGQVIGRLFGSNSTTTVPQTALYGEQRFVPLFVYKPSILDGYATLRGLFKIDYTFGDVAYGVGGNRGGAINGGQINLQTLLANVDIHPKDATWNVVIGLQRLFDNARDPNVTTLQVMQTSAYKLSFWGTQAVGINLFANLSPETKGRLGYFQLWENVISKDDDVALFMADIESRISPDWEVGADLWYLHDFGQEGGGISVLGQGLTSALAEYNGAVRIRLPGFSQAYKAHIGWVGAHAAFNRDFLKSRWWIDGYAIANYATIDTLGTQQSKAASIIGVAANASVAYKYGMTVNDKIAFEALYTTGEDKPGKTVTSVLTGNIWGSPVGIYGSHRALLLFPDPQVVNRYYSAVHDISNMGLGTTAFFLNAYKDFIPNKFNGKIGISSAWSNAAPTGGGTSIGTEVNVELKYNLKVFLTLGFSAGYLALGDFYDSPAVSNTQKKPVNPWTAFTTLTWLMF